MATDHNVFQIKATVTFAGTEFSTDTDEQLIHTARSYVADDWPMIRREFFLQPNEEAEYTVRKARRGSDRTVELTYHLYPPDGEGEFGKGEIVQYELDDTYLEHQHDEPEDEEENPEEEYVYADSDDDD